ncbi:MAG: MFS transporter [Calditrichaeota bacterium]|nr:MFS transporter [Calditrichota bacterium]
MFSMLMFGEVIARKSLGASEFTVTLLTMTMPVAALTSIWWGRLLVGRNQRKILLFFGAIAYLALSSGLFLGSVSHILAMYVIFYLFNALMTTAENRILQQHIPSKVTGKLFGLASGMRTGIAAMFSVFAGFYMDHVTNGFRHLYVLIAFIGFLGLTQVASIKTHRIEGAESIPLNHRMLLEPLQKLIQLLKRRPDFLRFEAAFMIYGIAFMMTLPVIPLFLVDDLKFDYGTIGIVRGMIPQLVMIMAIPIIGRFFDRSTPHRMAVVFFFMLAFFPVFLLLSAQLEGILRTVMVCIAFGLFGITMSGIILLWSLSSLRFAQNEDVGVYHSVHVAATGVRGTFGPLLGYLVMTTMGKTTALLASSVLWLISSFAIILVRKWDIRKEEFQSLRTK